MWKKLINLSLVGAMSISFITMGFAGSASAASNIPTSNLQNEITQSDIVVVEKNENTKHEEIQPYGLKGMFVKGAIETIKFAIDKGGSVLNYILKWFDKDTAAYFNKNKNKVVKALDKLDDWIDEAEDFTQTTIKKKLNTFLLNAGVSTEYSLIIADSLARTITWIIG